jgi:hypothetical protein
MLVRISNLREDSAVASDDFVVSIDALEGPYLVDAAGVGLKPEQRGSLEAQIDHLLGQGEAALPVARAVVETIRKRAADLNEVGRGVMLNNLPRAPGPPDGMMLSGGWPEKSARTFAYFHEEDKHDLWLAPLVVSSDGSAMSNLEATGSRLAFPSLGEPLPDSADMVPGMIYSDPKSSLPLGGAIGQAVRAVPKIGRNDPCWCESGKKLKKCHGS